MVSTLKVANERGPLPGQSDGTVIAVATRYRAYIHSGLAGCFFGIKCLYFSFF